MKSNNKVIGFYKKSKNGNPCPITKSKRKTETVMYSTKKFKPIIPNSLNNKTDLSFDQKLEDELEKLNNLETELWKLQNTLEEKKQAYIPKKIESQIKEKEKEIKNQLNIIGNLKY